MCDSFSLSIENLYSGWIDKSPSKNTREHPTLFITTLLTRPAALGSPFLQPRPTLITPVSGLMATAGAL